VKRDPLDDSVVPVSFLQNRQFLLYRAAGVKRVRWMSRRAEDSCEACFDADDIEVALGEYFPHVNVQGPPAHEGCACAISPADEDLGERIGSREDRDRATRGGYTAEEYFERTGRLHRIDRPGRTNRGTQVKNTGTNARTQQARARARARARWGSENSGLKTRQLVCRRSYARRAREAPSSR